MSKISQSLSTSVRLRGMKWTNMGRQTNKQSWTPPADETRAGWAGRLTFLADRASRLAGGGDMVLTASDVTLVRAWGLSFTTFCSSEFTRSMLLAGDDAAFTPDVSPTGALLVPIDSWERERTQTTCEKNIKLRSLYFHNVNIQSICNERKHLQRSTWSWYAAENVTSVYTRAAWYIKIKLIL